MLKKIMRGIFSVMGLVIGYFIAEKYLGGLDKWQMNVELDKQSGEDRDQLKNIVASKLASFIEMGHNDELNRIKEGISYLKPDSKVQEIYTEIEQLFKEYEQARQQAQEETNKSAAGLLKGLGISGSAIGAFNPKANIEWQLESNLTAEPYVERLELLQQKLIDTIKA